MYLFLIFGAYMSLFAYRQLAEFNRLLRAPAYAGHTMNADSVIPDRFSVLKLYGSGGTALFTLTAAYAVIAHFKIPGLGKT